MDEIYRALGKEHEADLERDAERWRRAAEVAGQPRSASAAPQGDRPRSRRFARPRIVAFLLRVARVEG